MKKIFLFISLIVIISIILTGCKTFSSFNVGDSELKIGVTDIEGNYNPLYSSSKTDREIINQIYPTILQSTDKNTFKNYCGGISYEFIGDSQVKYTITIKDNLRFSDGTYVTIEDIISFFYFISDASYDGVYSDFYLNDISGIKEYYYDDNNYESALTGIDSIVSVNYSKDSIETADLTDYLIETKIEGKFTGNLDSPSPTGETWRDYFLRFQYKEELDSLGLTPSDDDVLKLAAKVEAEQNQSAYNPENWFREKLYNEYIEKNYSNGISVNEISGIKKINDYTCTILFNSKNINALSQLNVPVLSTSSYFSEYIKGSAEKVKNNESLPIGCGPYCLDDYSDDDVSLVLNKFYSGDKPDFSKIRFIDISDGKKNPSEYVSSGKVDIAADVASVQLINSLDQENTLYFISNQKEYTSLFFNVNTLTYSQRKALMGLCSLNTSTEKQIGSYFTGLKRPLSIRFEEYPTDITESFYKESAYVAFTMLSDETIPELSAYIIKDADYLESTWIEEYRNILLTNGIKLNIFTVNDEKELRSAIASGNADIWFEKIKDTPTCDCYDRFNSSGSMNYAGFNNPEIDSLTVQIRASVGLVDKTALTGQLLDLVMEQAIECPLYQLQNVTVYNTETINENSFTSNMNYDGFTYIISMLKKN